MSQSVIEKWNNYVAHCPFLPAPPCSLSASDFLTWPLQCRIWCVDDCCVYISSMAPRDFQRTFCYTSVWEYMVLSYSMVTKWMVLTTWKILLVNNHKMITWAKALLNWMYKGLMSHSVIHWINQSRHFMDLS